MRIALLGAGQMGSGIAQVCAVSGCDVDLCDSSKQLCAKALASIEKGVQKQAKRKELTSRAALQAIERIVAHDSPGRWIAKADFVIEAITENLADKRQLFAQVAPLMKSDAILATNTSSLPITSLARGCGREDRFIGVHFMNPVPLMPLVEIIGGVNTSADTAKKAKALVKKLGKQAVLAADYPGFIANRILMPLINEAAHALMEGVGSAKDIDATARLGLNHPMGPLELADLIGLDTCVAIMRTLHEGHGDPKFSPCPLLVRLAEAGHFGRKAKRGFYDYSTGHPRPAT